MSSVTSMIDNQKYMLNVQKDLLLVTQSSKVSYTLECACTSAGGQPYRFLWRCEDVTVIIIEYLLYCIFLSDFYKVVLIFTWR